MTPSLWVLINWNRYVNYLSVTRQLDYPVNLAISSLQEGKFLSRVLPNTGGHTHRHCSFESVLKVLESILALCGKGAYNMYGPMQTQRVKLIHTRSACAIVAVNVYSHTDLSMHIRPYLLMAVQGRTEGAIVVVLAVKGARTNSNTLSSHLHFSCTR